MHIEQLIHAMQQRSKMFMKDVRLDYIYYIIAGYCGAQRDDAENSLDKKFCGWFTKWLQIWIQENSKIDTLPNSTWWYETLLMSSENEEEAIKLFLICVNCFLMIFIIKEVILHLDRVSRGRVAETELLYNLRTWTQINAVEI